MSGILSPSDGFTLAGQIEHDGLDLSPPSCRAGRSRHPYGFGPFAKLKMPVLPDRPGVYLWDVDSVVMYVGQTTGSLRKRLGSNGYATISAYNTLAPEPGRKNGGQETNCRINALANSALATGQGIVLWYRVTEAEAAGSSEAEWMTRFGVPAWNRRTERVSEGVPSLGLRSREELDLAAMTVGFELDAATQAEVALRTAIDAPGSVLMLEAGMLHLRQVANFVFCTRQARFRRDDIKPADFLFGRESWAAEEADRARWHDEYAAIFDKHLMHLTWDRVRPTGVPFSFTTSFEHVRDTLEQFVVHLGQVGSPQHQQFHVAFEASYRISTVDVRRNRFDIVAED